MYIVVGAGWSHLISNLIKPPLKHLHHFLWCRSHRNTVSNGSVSSCLFSHDIKSNILFLYLTASPLLAGKYIVYLSALSLLRASNYQNAEPKLVLSPRPNRSAVFILKLSF